MKQMGIRDMTFAQLREMDRYYVDKTMLIADTSGQGTATSICSHAPLDSGNPRT